MERFVDFFTKNLSFGGLSFNLKLFLIFLLIFFAARLILRLFKRIVSRNFTSERKGKFKPIFGFLNYSIYTIIILLALQNMGVELTAIFAASAALLVGIGFALQTFFQDIISGVFILIDQSVHVGDIIEVDGKVGKVENITLRTTRAVTIDNKVLVIPNHLYLTNTLYNWTENGKITRERVAVSVAYGTDLQLVTKILTDIAVQHNAVLKTPPPTVLFQKFGESSLDFEIAFSLKNSFKAVPIQSDIRFSIYEAFAEHNIEIPFPQRVIHST